MYMRNSKKHASAKLKSCQSVATQLPAKRLALSLVSIALLRKP